MDFNVRGKQRIDKHHDGTEGEKIQLRCKYLAGV